MSLIERLEEARRREKDQTLFYRALAARAEDRGESEASQRLVDLHADEQHHLSRLTARVLELGGDPLDLRGRPGPQLPAPEAWEAEARAREDREIAFYEAFLRDGGPDGVTREVVEEILEAERLHRRHLGGKWMSA